MSQSEIFRAVMYSLKPFPQELRKGFKLPDYPFINGDAGPLPESVEAYFKGLGVIHYRDEIKPRAILIQPDDGDPTPLYERLGFKAFRLIVVLKYAGMSPAQLSMAEDPVKYRRAVQRAGDDYAWLHWNKQLVINSINEDQVSCG